MTQHFYKILLFNIALIAMSHSHQINIIGGMTFLDELRGVKYEANAEKNISTDANHTFFGDVSYVFNLNNEVLNQQSVFLGIGFQIFTEMAFKDNDESIGAFNLPLYLSFNYDPYLLNSKLAEFQPVFRIKAGYNHIQITDQDKIDRAWGNFFGAVGLEARISQYFVIGSEFSAKRFEYFGAQDKTQRYIYHLSLNAYIGGSFKL